MDRALIRKTLDPDMRYGCFSNRYGVGPRVQGVHKGWCFLKERTWSVLIFSTQGHILSRTVHTYWLLSEKDKVYTIQPDVQYSNMNTWTVPEPLAGLPKALSSLFDHFRCPSLPPLLFYHGFLPPIYILNPKFHLNNCFQRYQSAALMVQGETVGQLLTHNKKVCVLLPINNS